MIYQYQEDHLSSNFRPRGSSPLSYLILLLGKTVNLVNCHNSLILSDPFDSDISQTYVELHLYFFCLGPKLKDQWCCDIFSIIQVWNCRNVTNHWVFYKWGEDLLDIPIIWSLQYRWKQSKQSKHTAICWLVKELLEYWRRI